MERLGDEIERSNLRIEGLERIEQEQRNRRDELQGPSPKAAVNASLNSSSASAAGIGLKGVKRPRNAMLLFMTWVLIGSVIPTAS